MGQGVRQPRAWSRHQRIIIIIVKLSAVRSPRGFFFLPHMQDGSGGPTADLQGPIGEQAVRACREALERVTRCVAALLPDRLLVPQSANTALQEPLELEVPLGFFSFPPFFFFSSLAKTSRASTGPLTSLIDTLPPTTPELIQANTSIDTSHPSFFHYTPEPSQATT